MLIGAYIHGQKIIEMTVRVRVDGFLLGKHLFWFSTYMGHLVENTISMEENQIYQHQQHQTF